MNFQPYINNLHNRVSNFRMPGFLKTASGWMPMTILVLCFLTIAPVCLITFDKQYETSSNDSGIDSDLDTDSGSSGLKPEKIMKYAILGGIGLILVFTALLLVVGHRNYKREHQVLRTVEPAGMPPY